MKKKIWSHINNPCPPRLSRLGCVVAILLLTLILNNSSPATAQISESSLYFNQTINPLQHTVEMDQTSLMLQDQQENDITSAALLYLDPEQKLDPTLIAQQYLNNQRPRLNQENLITFGKSTSALWLVIPIQNRTNQNQWLIDFGHRLSGRTSPFSSLTIVDLLNNQIYFKQGLEKSNTSLTTTSTRQYTTTIPVTIKSRSYNLIAIKMVLNPGAPFLSPLKIISPTLGPSLQPWLFESSYLMAALFISGIIFALTILSGHSILMCLGFYIITLTGISLIPMPLIDSTSYIARLHPIIVTLSGFFLSMSACALARLSGIQMAWNSVQATIVMLNIVMLFGLLLAPPLALNNPILQIIFTLPGTLIALLFGMIKLRKGDANGIYMTLLGMTYMGGHLIQNLAIMGIIPAHIGTLNTSLFSIFLAGPLSILLLYHTNIFAEAIDFAKRRKRSLNDEEQLAKLRHAKESFDYNNLLKVIDHERKQLADARARESLRSEEMRKARDMADEANRAKSAFLAVISHEIRTPMTGIMGMVKLLLDTTLNKNQHEFVITVKESGNAMMTLLNDILDFEKIESGKMQLEMLDFDLHRLVSSITSLMSGHTTAKGIDLKIDMDENVPQYVIGDVTRLRQVLLNLVGNAVKFTQKGSVTIKLSATHNEKNDDENDTYQIYFAIIDTGIGISPEAQKNIFNPFAQADKTIARKFGGSGLGLAISKRLIEAMGSQINIKSRENEGTTFFFSLNMQPGDPEIADEIAGKNAARSTPSRMTPAERAELPKLRIMVVEDNVITQKVLKTIIEQGQHETLICSSAEEALPYLNMGERFDLILSDIQMEGMSGYQFARTIRTLEDPISRNVPIYALTGNVDESDIRACLDSGMNGHLAKPIDPDAFDGVLREVSEKRNTTYQVQQAKPVTGSATIRPITIDPELELLTTLRESLGDTQVDQLLQGMYSKAEEIIAALTHQIEENADPALIRDRAHELKGMCGNFGMKTLSELARQIEKQAQEGSRETLTALIAKLPTTYQTGRQKIDLWLHHVN